MGLTPVCIRFATEAPVSLQHKQAKPKNTTGNVNSVQLPQKPSARSLTSVYADRRHISAILTSGCQTCWCIRTRGGEEISPLCFSSSTRINLHTHTFAVQPRGQSSRTPTRSRRSEHLTVQPRDSTSRAKIRALAHSLTVHLQLFLALRNDVSFNLLYCLLWFILIFF